MTNRITSKVDDLLSDGYDFKFSEYISEGFSILNKNVGGFIGYFGVFVIINMATSSIPYLGDIVGMVISYPLTAGFYLVASRISKNETYEFGNFFDGFQLFVPLLILMIFTTLISVAAALPMLAVVGFELFELFIGGLANDPATILEMFESLSYPLLFLTAIPFIYISIAYGWAPFFVIFHKMSAWEAMEASRKVITKQWFIFLGFGFVIALIGISGIIALGVGLLYTIPFIYCALYAAFNDVVGTSEEDIKDDVIDHLVV